MTRSGLAYPTAADVVRWLNTVRPIGELELTEANIKTPEWIADYHDAVFRQLVRSWGG